MVGSHVFYYSWNRLKLRSSQLPNCSRAWPSQVLWSNWVLDGSCLFSDLDMVAWSIKVESNSLVGYVPNNFCDTYVFVSSPSFAAFNALFRLPALYQNRVPIILVLFFQVCDFGLSRLKHHTFLSSKSTAGTVIFHLYPVSALFNVWDFTCY